MDFLSKALKSGISVKNESAVPLLVIVSQVTPLYWGRVDPGEIWNKDNHMGLGKVWFTVTVSIFDEENEPTVASVALKLAAIAVAVPLSVPLAAGSMALIAGGAILASGTAALAGLGAMAFGSTVLASTVAGAASITLSGVRSVVGTRKTGVYSDGSTLIVRGSVQDHAEYHLRYAEAHEVQEMPYAGPPPKEQWEAMMKMIKAPVYCNEGIQIKNESAVPLLVICSQLSPLHWGKVMPGEVWNENNSVGMGRVWFTVSVSPFKQSNVPTQMGVAGRIGAVVVAHSVGLPLFIGGAALMGLTSTNGLQVQGVLADGRKMTVRGTREVENMKYSLFFASDEDIAKNPYFGPPPEDEVQLIQDMIASSSSATGRDGEFTMKEVMLRVEDQSAGLVISPAQSPEASAALVSLPALSAAVVTSLTPGGKAEAAGIPLGASLVLVNGEDVSAMPFSEANARVVRAATNKSAHTPLVVVFRIPIRVNGESRVQEPTPTTMSSNGSTGALGAPTRGEAVSLENHAYLHVAPEKHV